MFRETLEYRQERWVRAGFPVQGALKQVTLSQQLPRDFHEISGKLSQKPWRFIESSPRRLFFHFINGKKWLREWLMPVHKTQSQTPNMVLLSIVCALLLLISCSVASHSFLDPVDCSPPGSSVHGMSQARILEWVAIPFSRGSSWPRDQTHFSWIAGRFFTVWATREASVCA